MARYNYFGRGDQYSEWHRNIQDDSLGYIDLDVVEFHKTCGCILFVAGNRERDHRTGFTTPPKLTLDSLLSFALHPNWVLNYLTHGKFKLANVAAKTSW